MPVYYKSNNRSSVLPKANVTVWLGGNALVSINEVTQRWTRLVLGWVTVCEWTNYHSRLPRSGQLSRTTSMSGLVRDLGWQSLAHRCFFLFLCFIKIFMAFQQFRATHSTGLFVTLSRHSDSDANANMVWRQRRPADTESRRRLRSASATSLDVRRTRLSTVGDRAFPVAAARLWNSLPSQVMHFRPSLSIFCCLLKSHLFSLSYSSI